MPPPIDDQFQVTRFLHMQPWFGCLPESLQDTVMQASFTVSGATGEVLLPAHECSAGWYAVLSGFVKLQGRGPDGQLSAFLALTGGEWFGEGSALQAEQRSYEVVALRDSQLLCLPRAQFHQLLAASASFNHAVLTHMNTRLRQAMAIIQADRQGCLEQRLALHLSRRFWHGLRRLNLSQEELGLLAGMSRQTANRGLKALQQRGLVTLQRGRVVSVDPTGLAQLIGHPAGGTVATVSTGVPSASPARGPEREALAPLAI